MAALLAAGLDHAASAAAADAQPGAGHPPGRYLFQGYDDSDGLGNLVVLSMLQSSNGLLWLSTENGLYRYDGFRFTRAAMPIESSDPAIIGVAEDRQHTIWAAVSDGQLMFLPQHGRWQRFDTPIRFTSRPAALGDGAVVIADDAIYHAHADGSLSILGPCARNTNLPPQLGMSGPLVSAGNAVWLLCGRHLLRVADESASPVDVGLSLPDEHWLEMLAASDGSLWLRSSRQLAHWVPHTRRVELMAVPRPLREGDGSWPALTELANGHVLTTGPDSLLEWTGTHWVVHDQSLGIPAYAISSLLLDQEKSLWLGTQGRGAFRALGFHAWQHFTRQDGLPSDLVWSIEQDTQGRHWVGTQSGATVLGAQGKAIALRQAPATTRPVLNMTPDTTGGMWVLQVNGDLLHYPAPEAEPIQLKSGHGMHLIRRLDANHLLLTDRAAVYSIAEDRPDAGAAVYGRFDDEPAQGIRDLFQGPDGRWWLIARNSVFFLSDGQWTPLRQPDGSLWDNLSNGAFDARGRLWLGGFGNGLHVITLSGDIGTEVPEAVNRSVLGSRNVLFIGTDLHQRMWIGTDVGVTTVNGESWQRLTRHDGLLWNDLDEGAFLADRDGTIWLGTSSGLSRLLNPEKLLAGPVPRITLLSARLGDTDLLLPHAERLPWSRKGLSFSLATPSFAVGQSLQLRFRLLGLDENWQTAESAQLRYPALPAGDYTLQLKAVNPLRDQQSQITELAFEVEPEFIRSTAFIVLIVLGVLGVGMVLAQLRLRIALRHSQKLERMVTERTVELENEKRELIAAREELEIRATHDPLTQIWNRGKILQVLQDAMIDAHVRRRDLAVALIDLDHFKRINDQHGHLTGDKVLREVAQTLRSLLEGGESLGRYGGEELLLVLPGLRPQVPSERVEALQLALRNQPVLSVDGTVLQITGSIGVAWKRLSSLDTDGLLQRADTALYAAKNAGRDRVVYDREHVTAD